MTTTAVPTLKLRNLTETQVAAFAQLFPVLTAAEKLDGSKVVTTTKTTIAIELRPGIFRRGPEAAVEQLVASANRTIDQHPVSMKRWIGLRTKSPLAALLDKLASGNPKHVEIA